MKIIQKWISSLLGKNLDAKIRAYFLKGSFQSLFLQAGLSLLTFLTTIIIAQFTGDKGFGIYSLVFTWISVVSVGATMGLDDLALKQFPIYHNQQQWKSAKGLLQWMQQQALLFSIGCSLIYILLVNFTKIPGLYDYALYHNCAALSIPFFVFMHLNQATLKGCKKLGLGQLAEKIIQPCVFFILLVLAYWLGWKVADLYAIIFRTLSFILAAILAFVFTYRFFKQKKITTHVEKLKPSEKQVYFRSCIFFMLSSLLYILNTRMDILLLGIFNVSAEEIAYYNVALKFSDIALIPFMVICTVITPLFSSLFYQQKIAELQYLYTRVTRLTTILISCILFIFISLGPWFLSWYGNSFKAAFPVLTLLAIAKFIHVFMGPASYLLTMTGQEKILTISLSSSVILTVGMHVIFIPLYGIEGAAWASLLGLLLFEGILAWVAYRKTGIIISAVGKLRIKKR